METEGNKVLAEFMELSVNLQYGIEVLMPPDNPSAKGYWTRPKYHDSWDWLMPVWIKFRDLDLESEDGDIYTDHLDYIKHLKDLLYAADSPSDFFPHLVEAVKWYNSTKK